MTEKKTFNQIFSQLSKLNVNKHTKEKQGLTYLSWSHAWQIACEKIGDVSYEIKEQENGLPYFDSEYGIVCKTTVTMHGITLPMTLPVMDGANKAMKKTSYSYKVKDYNESRKQGKTCFKEKTVEPASMFDINKTIMRCLVKNIALFGLGLYIYNGEDLPNRDFAEEIKKIDTAKNTEELKTVFNSFDTEAKHELKDYVTQIGKKLSNNAEK